MKVTRQKRSGAVGDSSSDRSSFIEPLDSRTQAMVRENKTVTLTGLRKEFPGDCTSVTKVAVDNVDVVFPEGSITILLGHNGAGRKLGVCDQLLCCCEGLTFCVD